MATLEKDELFWAVHKINTTKIVGEIICSLFRDIETLSLWLRLLILTSYLKLYLEPDQGVSNLLASLSYLGRRVVLGRT